MSNQTILGLPAETLVQQATRRARGQTLLRAAFITGAAADLAIAVNWLLISTGRSLPNLMSGYVGAGANYAFAMYISTLFMFGWSVIMVWGAVRPFLRRALLPITAFLLAISLAVDLVAYRDVLGGPQFVVGLTARLLLMCIFAFAWAYSRGPGQPHESSR